jgi:hypothetical protein
MKASKGVAQGTNIGQSIFNVYLNDALQSQPELREAITQGLLLAYADDIVVRSGSLTYVRGLVEAFKRLEQTHRLRINLEKARYFQLAGDYPGSREYLVH